VAASDSCTKEVRVIETGTVNERPRGPEPVLRAAQRRASIQMASMLVSVVIFLVVVEVLKRRPDHVSPSDEGFELLRIIFYALAIAMVFVINVVQGLMLKAEKSDDIGRITNRLTTVNAIVGGLAESPAILGIVLFVGWGYDTDFYILGFVSLYLMVRHFPFYRHWEKFARNRMGAKWPSGPVSE
jgi:hypothetical protein